MTESPPVPETDPNDPIQFVERAIRNVLGQIPEAGDERIQTTPKTAQQALQPWAEKVAPTSKNKRQLETLIAEYRDRIENHPNAMVVFPEKKRPDELFFEKLQSRPKKRQRRRRSGSGGREGGAPNGNAFPSLQSSPGRRPAGRSRRGGGGRPPRTPQ